MSYAVRPSSLTSKQHARTYPRINLVTFVPGEPVRHQLMEQVATLKLAAMFRHPKTDQCSVRIKFPRGSPDFQLHGGCSSSSQQKQPAPFHFDCWFHLRHPSSFLEWLQNCALSIDSRLFLLDSTYWKPPRPPLGIIKDFRRALSPHLPPATPGQAHSI
jgi:hypothetical protein